MVEFRSLNFLTVSSDLPFFWFIMAEYTEIEEENKGKPGIPTNNMYTLRNETLISVYLPKQRSNNVWEDIIGLGQFNQNKNWTQPENLKFVKKSWNTFFWIGKYAGIMRFFKNLNLDKLTWTYGNFKIQNFFSLKSHLERSSPIDVFHIAHTWLLDAYECLTWISYPTFALV